MNFSLTDEQQAFREMARSVAREVIRPQADAWERDASPLPLEYRRKLADLGLLGIALPEQYGGAGSELLLAVLAIEEIARESQTAAWAVFEAAVGPARVLELIATPEQRQRWLPPIIRGEIAMALAISEADAGSAATDLRTTARPSGDGVVLNGAKQWCSGSGHAEWYMVYCRMSDDPGARGIGAVLVPHDAEGLSFGPRQVHMGSRGIPHADMFFEDCQVPSDCVVVGPGGFGKLFRAFSTERIGNATMSLAIASSCTDQATRHVQERHQFGRPIVDFQAVQMTLADMIMRTDAARLLVWRAAANAGTGVPDPKEASIAKCYANETARFVADAALNLFGAAGYSTEHTIERHVRDSYGWPLAGGTPTMQRMRIVSEHVGRRFDQRLGVTA